MTCDPRREVQFFADIIKLLPRHNEKTCGSVPMRSSCLSRYLGEETNFGTRAIERCDGTPERKASGPPGIDVNLSSSSQWSGAHGRRKVYVLTKYLHPSI